MQIFMNVQNLQQWENDRKQFRLLESHAVSKHFVDEDLLHQKFVQDLASNDPD